jgi:hypothetical protein
MSRLFLLGVFVMSACIGTPQPDPPDLDLEGVPSPWRGGTLDVIGSPGNVRAGDALAWGVNLDTAEAPITAPLALDGTFRLFGLGYEGDTVRIEIRSGDVRSEPVDVVLAEARLTPIEPPLGHCLELEPVLDLGAAPAAGTRIDGMVLARSECTGELAIEVRVRVAGPFEALSAPTVIAPGSDAVIAVRFTAPASGSAFEEILFVEVASPVRDRRAVTLSARGPDG